ncbi:MAG: hypothetical protein AVDCRST_MAG44-1605 [uncultured Sphingomonas sp.]|uniref:Uncharacterized protein n=1 Tax=uncultured Sphingomonas sp. TaxID=158754 RepID=A0A6J4T6H1_9SPHN|nr:MAG: hypothetical protein AVDCRST_MAG44-1605 [uncultured Sphingomonas sp.]
MAVGFRPILLVDLDGVVVIEVDRNDPATRELLILHQGLAASLAAAAQHVFIVTHRSRREAEKICQAAELEVNDSLALIGAEDLFREACTTMQIRQLARFGLRKTYALSIAQRMTGAKPDDFVILDDRQQNLDPCLKAGIGLALKAPAAVSDDGRTIATFDMRGALRSMPKWYADRGTRRQIDIPAIARVIEPWQKSGISTAALGDHMFNRARRLASSLRTRQRER